MYSFDVCRLFGSHELRLCQGASDFTKAIQYTSSVAMYATKNGNAATS